jgi:tetratricopeptide (TPR) repeat protein
MTLIRTNTRIQETALGAVSCFAAVLLLSGCGPREDFADLYVAAPQEGVSSKTMSGILTLQERLATQPSDEKIPYLLAYAYLQAARENADSGFYDRVEGLVQQVEDRGITSPEHAFLRGTVAMAKHDFPAALALAEPLVRENPDVPRYHGLLADAQIETGRYDDAVTTLQAMADLNPDASALTRIAYVREIYGDLEGAREVMASIAQQGGAGENAAWSLCEYARLQLTTDPVNADALYDAALRLYPNYAPALAGKAKAAMALGKTDDAKQYATDAFTRLPLPEYSALLGDIAAYGEDAAGAARWYALTDIGYDELAKSGTDVSFEKTKFRVDRGIKIAEILPDAKRLYEERSTIYGADTYAWALHLSGDTQGAQTVIGDALKTGSKDPLILLHAGIILPSQEGRRHLETARTEHSYFPFLHRKELEAALNN